MLEALFHRLSIALDSAGAPGFCGELLHACHAACALDFLLLEVAEGDGWRAADGAGVAGVPVRAHLGSVSDADPAAGAAPVRPLIRRVDAAHGRLGAVDGLTLCWRAPRGALRLTLGRTRRLGLAAPSEIDDIKAAAPLLARMADLHVAGARLQAAAGEAELPAALAARLTVREAAVLSEVLRGKSARSIAETFGVKPTTVITLRKRAYSKLEVRGQADLLPLVIDAIHALQRRRRDPPAEPIRLAG